MNKKIVMVLILLQTMNAKAMLTRLARTGAARAKGTVLAQIQKFTGEKLPPVRAFSDKASREKDSVASFLAANSKKD